MTQNHTGAQAEIGTDSYPSTGHAAQTALAAPQPERWANIPAALRERAQWVLAGVDKRPLKADGGTASSTDPSTWTDFDTACRAAMKKGLHIGYVLHGTDPFTCIDMDVKDDTPQEHIDRFQNIVAVFDSYTERSRSGKGLHVWVEGKIGKGRKRDGVEVYSQERFIICTGDVVDNKPVSKRQELLDNLASQMQASTTAEVQLHGDDCPDSALAARAVEDSGELGRLFRGDWVGRYPSQSEADLALIKMLMPRTDSPRECWQTFRLSKLGQRDKAARPDYMRRTLAQAQTHLANDAAHVQHGMKVFADWHERPQQDIARHFRLLSDDDLRALPVQRWLVKGVIPEGSVGTIFGQSGTFKSFLVLDLMAHIANGQPWFGHRVKAASAVYVPFEGQGGIPKRVQAWRLARESNGCTDATTGMRFITDRMNLRLQADRDKLVQTLIECGSAGGVLCIDTLAQAGAGIDENSSEGMGEMIAVFQELQQRTGGTVLVVHHSGKDEKAGMRGWSGLRGALDFAVKCWRDEKWNALDAQFMLDKVKDGESGHTFNFSMSRVHIGFDEDGEPITSLAVAPAVETVRAELMPPSDAQRDVADDEFIWQWVSQEVAAGTYPSKNSLKKQVNAMKPRRHMTQDRVFAAIERLMACSRLAYAATTSTSGNKWIRAVDVPTGGA